MILIEPIKGCDKWSNFLDSSRVNIKIYTVEHMVSMCLMHRMIKYLRGISGVNRSVYGKVVRQIVPRNPLLRVFAFDCMKKISSLNNLKNFSLSKMTPLIVGSTARKARRRIRKSIKLPKRSSSLFKTSKSKEDLFKELYSYVDENRRIYYGNPTEAPSQSQTRQRHLHAIRIPDTNTTTTASGFARAQPDERNVTNRVIDGWMEQEVLRQESRFRTTVERYLQDEYAAEANGRWYDELFYNVSVNTATATDYTVSQRFTPISATDIVDAFEA